MADFSPSIVPLGSLADVAAASAAAAREEKVIGTVLRPIDPGTTTGIIAEPDVIGWP
jgi:hypothetical protein